MDWRDFITMTPGIRSGKPRLKESRLTVQDVLEYLAGGDSYEELQDAFPELNRDRIRACLAYVADRERESNAVLMASRLTLAQIEEGQLWSLLSAAERMGLNLEVNGGSITWETAPGIVHQELAMAIYQAIRTEAPEFVPAVGVFVRFPSGTVKRPDVSIFCRRPEQKEGFVKVVPEAVIEVTSPGYEAKDLITGPGLYLANGVKDVIVLDRRTNTVRHTDAAGTREHPSPVTLTLACGCRATV